MKSNTFIYLWRSILDTSFYKNPLTCHLAIHLMLSAAWKDHKIMVGGKEVLIMRGQVPTGRNKLSDETGLSPQNIRTCLKHLKKCGFLTIKSTKQLSIITLCKYNSYQTHQPTTQPSKQPTPNQRLTNDQPLQNKGNKGNNKKIYGEFKNVRLTDEEFEKLKIKFNSTHLDRIEALSQYVEQKGKRYKSHYATILTWARKDPAPEIEYEPIS